jgi:hypothetical protein
MFAAISAGELEVIVGDTYPLEEARRAHEDIRTAHHGQARPGPLTDYLIWPIAPGRCSGV